MDHPFLRLLPRAGTLISFLVLLIFLVMLAFFGLAPPWVLLLPSRFWPAPMFLQELFRSRGVLSVRVRTLHLALIEPRSFFFGTAGVARLFLAFPLVVVASYSGFGSQDCKGSEYKSNPDIVGSGVRPSMYLLFLAVFASLFIGSFHSGPSGTKELGIATLD